MSSETNPQTGPCVRCKLEVAAGAGRLVYGTIWCGACYRCLIPEPRDGEVNSRHEQDERHGS